MTTDQAIEAALARVYGIQMVSIKARQTREELAAAGYVIRRRAVRPEDITDGMLEAFEHVIRNEHTPTEPSHERRRRAIAAAINAGGEQ